MEHPRQFKTWVLFYLAAFIICLDSRVDAEKKRLYIKTETNPKQIHHHHYYTISDPMFGSSRNVAMKSRPEQEVFERPRYNRDSPSNRFNHMDMDYYNGHPVHSDYPLPDHYHDDSDSYSKAARLLRMTPPPIQSSPNVRYQQHDIPEDPLPLKSGTRSRRVPTYRVSPDIYSPDYQRSFFSDTDKHHNVRHVYTSEIVEDDY